MTFDQGPADHFDNLFAGQQASRATLRPQKRFPLLAHLATLAETEPSQLAYEAADALAALEALDRTFTRTRAHQARHWCHWCNHASPHPCTVTGCACLCRHCGWNAYGPHPDTGPNGRPCHGPLCSATPDDQRAEPDEDD